MQVLIEAIAIVIGAGTLIAALVLYSSLSWGYVLLKFWSWYLLPVFPNMPHITFWQAVGLMFIVDLFKNHSSEGIKDEYKDKTSAMTMSLLAPWITIMAAMLINLFIK